MRIEIKITDDLGNIKQYDLSLDVWRHFQLSKILN
jgi:hypothetical protein